MSLHLCEVPKASATNVTLDTEFITMLALVLFEVSYIRSAVVTLVTFMHHTRVILGMTN